MPPQNPDSVLWKISQQKLHDISSLQPHLGSPESDDSQPLTVIPIPTLTVKFLTKRFISEYDPNLEDTYTSEETVDQQPVLLRVMDTADQDVPRNCKRYLSWAQAFLIVYSIDDRRNFEGCSQYLEIISHHAKETQHDYPVLLLGNKLDMAQYRYGPVIYLSLSSSQIEVFSGKSDGLRWRRG
ncbi:ras-like protein family member 12 [Gracilinanus agilis]|uniref:ras-like protein family member 12 n=1 Tax=Gracilinanus agilis TaxID=191870 RepID=UPI001CFD371D|nr:ras-like protein family member 12 [Gracilinanus agilis]